MSRIGDVTARMHVIFFGGIHSCVCPPGLRKVLNKQLFILGLLVYRLDITVTMLQYFGKFS
jgi:hypothetical protein